MLYKMLLSTGAACLLLIQVPVPKNVGQSSLRCVCVGPEHSLGPLFRNSDVETRDYVL